MVVRARWLYTRAADSIQIEVCEDPARFLVIVYGPGQRWHHQTCADYLEAMRVQFVFEEQLLARGFMLGGFEHDEAMTRTDDVRPWAPLQVPATLDRALAVDSVTLH